MKRFVISKKWAVGVLALLSVAGLLSAGCGGDDSTAQATSAPTAVPTTASATPAPPAPVDVTVSLSEFKIESSLTTFQAGVPYHFIITNSGAVPHEVNIANVDATGEVPSRATKSLDVTFTDPGQQEFACHITGHYEAGMKLPVTIGP